MDFLTTRSKQNTAIVSTLVAVAILAGGVTAYQSHHAEVEDVVQLESDLRFQLEIVFRHDPNERARRLVQLKKVSQAWQQSPRTIADRKKLASWLLAATVHSMPGSTEALPSIPSFGEHFSQAVTQQSPEVLAEPLVRIEKLEPVAQVPAPTAVMPIPASLVSAEIIERSTDLPESLTTPQPVAPMPHSVEAPIPINLTELAARIAGYHDGLDEVERALLLLEAEDNGMLAAQIRQLETMTRDYRFVQLYYQSLTDKERQGVDSPRSMAALLAEITRRIDRTQETLSEDFLGEFDSGNQDQIATLRQQLAGIRRRLDP